MSNVSFTRFYTAVRSWPPLPWMERLATELVDGRWPDVLALPTGTAKTEIVVVWTWALAMAAPGRVPRRLWMASDRRVIADQAEQVARVLGDRLDDRAAPADVQAVADALRRRGGGAVPLKVGLLRGGIVTDDEPLLDPVTPMAIATTVDQVGSRLLFRAYGSGPREWPIWAGLVGEDSLIVLDEAHLSAAAEATIRKVRALGAGVRLLSMTATPRAAELTAFSLDEADRAHPDLRQRLAASRLVVLRKAAQVEEAMLAAATEALASGARRVAVICNTVRRARDLFARLPEKPVDRFLLIGRSRPLDRDAIMGELIPRVRSGAAPSPPLIVVTTQCIEAGADFDFDGMVSEACPLDALRQRLGRLDRLGNAGTSRCVLVAPGSFEETPPYGVATGAAWAWLEQGAGKAKQVDLGLLAWERLVAEQPPSVETSSVPTTPVSFLEPHLRMLVRTWPRPAVEPDIDLLLHGLGHRGGDVSIVWRADVAPDDADAAAEVLEILPPTALEAVQVPIWEAQRWLEAGPVDGEIGDVEGAVETAPARAGRDERSSQRAVLRWLGTEDGVEVVSAARLRPGDVVVAPDDQGGCDRWGWAPQGPIAAVVDLGDAAWSRKTGRQVTRVALGEDMDSRDLLARESGDGRYVRVWSKGVVVFALAPGQHRRLAQGREVALTAHTGRVVEQVRRDATALGLDVDDLVLAARWHDAGKDTPSWQLMIRGGDPSRLHEPPLAKGLDRSWREAIRARRLARLPQGWRHEAESVRRLEAGPELATAADADLVRWLVATHHGYGRPWWPAVEGAAVDPGLATLMVRLGRRHGWWRLANLEAVLRCADRSVSRWEAEGHA